MLAERIRLIRYNLYLLEALAEHGGDGSVKIKLEKMLRNRYQRKLENYREELECVGEQMLHDLKPNRFVVLKIWLAKTRYQIFKDGEQFGLAFVDERIMNNCLKVVRSSCPESVFTVVESPNEVKL